MASKKDAKLSNLIGRNLVGWQFLVCYGLALDTGGLMGFFPAITTADNMPVYVTEKKQLKPVWDKLVEEWKPREALIIQFPALVNTQHRVAFNLINLETYNLDRKPVRILSADEVKSLCGLKGSFKWKSGLMGSINQYARPPDFT